MKEPLLHKVAETIRRHGLLGARAAVLVAVSAGPDSVALLAALMALNRGGWRIGVGHVNHRLRGRDSDRDEQLVRRLGARLGCEVWVAAQPIVGRHNLEERARERRYAALAKMARREGFRHVATAHTLDDQAETVLHRLIRGAGPAGLAGIHARRADRVIRPLLDVSRAQVLEFLNGRRLPYRLDRSNASMQFTRNRLRRRVLPMLEREFNPRVKQALARLAELAGDDERMLERMAERRARRASGVGGLDCTALRRMPVALQRRVLRCWLEQVRGDLRGIDQQHVENLRRLAAVGRDGQQRSLPGGAVVRSAGRLRWGSGAQRATVVEQSLEIGSEVRISGWRIRARAQRRRVAPSRWRAVFDLGDVDGGSLRVRGFRRGDRIRPLGLGGTKKLQDVFVDAKIPREDRPTWPIVELAGEVAWVAGLVRSEHALVGPRSRRLLVVEARRDRPATVRRAASALPR